MEAHQIRVVNEKEELDEKLSKLSAFLLKESFEKLDPEEQNRLLEQADIMQEYSDVLNRRIVAFK